MGKKNYKNAWTLAECALALFILSMLILASVQTFKSKIPTDTPFAYAAIRNLSRVATFITEESPNHVLPEGYRTIDIPDADNNPISTPMVEMCWRMADILSIMGEAQCSAPFTIDPNDETVKLVDFSYLQGNNFNANFQTTNLITYFGLERPFDMCTETSHNSFVEVDSLGAALVDGQVGVNYHHCENNGVGTPTTLKRGRATRTNECDKVDAKIKDIYIDINGAGNGADAFGEDRFPIKIYDTGEVIPGTCATVNEVAPTSCSGYIVDSPIKANPACSGDTTNYLIERQPFSYNIYNISMPTPEQQAELGLAPNERVTTVVEREISFAEADCRARGNVFTKGQCQALENAFNAQEGNPCRSFLPLDGNQGNITTASGCVATNNNPRGITCVGENNFCIVRQAKPISMGFMGLPY